MMSKDDYRHFVCIVAGDNPNDLMKEYDKSKKFDLYVKFKYKDAKRIRNNEILLCQAIIENSDNLPEFYIEDINERISELKEMSDDDYFDILTADLEHDENTGDALTDENPNGKWSNYHMGKMFSVPFLLKDGRESFQAKKSEIDWDKMHMNGKETYEKVWELVIDKRKPNDENEEKLFNNMKDFETYLKKFETKENYVLSNIAFWGYAFLSDKTGWIELEDTINQFVWVRNYFNMFIKNLPEDTLLTIFECTR